MVCRDEGEARGALCTGPRPVDTARRSPSPEDPACLGGAGATSRCVQGGPCWAAGAQLERKGLRVPSRLAHQRWPSLCCPVKGQPGSAWLMGRKAENEACGLCGHFWAHAMANAHGSLSRKGSPHPHRPRPHSRACPSHAGCSWGRLCLRNLSSMTTWHRWGIPARRPRPRLWPAWDPGVLGLADTRTSLAGSDKSQPLSWTRATP